MLIFILFCLRDLLYMKVICTDLSCKNGMLLFKSNLAFI